jgi:hypothetical protein
MTGCEIDDGERLRALCDSVTAGRVVLAARARFDAHAGQFQKWLRHLRHRRVLNPRHEQRAPARRTEDRPRRRRRVQDVEHVLRRQVVTGDALRGRPVRGQCEGGGRKQSCRQSESDARETKV